MATAEIYKWSNWVGQCNDMEDFNFSSVYPDRDDFLTAEEPLDRTSYNTASQHPPEAIARFWPADAVTPAKLAITAVAFTESVYSE